MSNSPKESNTKQALGSRYLVFDARMWQQNGSRDVGDNAEFWWRLLSYPDLRADSHVGFECERGCCVSGEFE